jgi:hypothetical protein
MEMALFGSSPWFYFPLNLNLAGSLFTVLKDIITFLVVKTRVKNFWRAVIATIVTTHRVEVLVNANAVISNQSCIFDHAFS